MTARSLDLLAPDLLPECPDCHDLAFPGATVCESCGAHLMVRQNSGRPFSKNVGPRGCTCDGGGVCVACVLDTYDNPAGESK